MFRNSTITDLFLFVFTQHIVYYPLQNIDINMKMDISIYLYIQNQESLLDISIRKQQKL